jgi:glutamate dehydrogenase/leucine dehydrogenase
MREIPFSNIQEISKNINNGKVVMFGSGNVADKTARLLTEYYVYAIADNAKNL